MIFGVNVGKHTIIYHTWWSKSTYIYSNIVLLYYILHNYIWNMTESLSSPTTAIRPNISPPSWPVPQCYGHLPRKPRRCSSEVNDQGLSKQKKQRLHQRNYLGVILYILPRYNTIYICNHVCIDIYICICSIYIYIYVFIFPKTDLRPLEDDFPY